MFPVLGLRGTLEVGVMRMRCDVTCVALSNNIPQQRQKEVSCGGFSQCPLVEVKAQLRKSNCREG